MNTYTGDEFVIRDKYGRWLEDGYVANTDDPRWTNDAGDNYRFRRYDEAADALIELEKDPDSHNPLRIEKMLSEAQSGPCEWNRKWYERSLFLTQNGGRIYRENNITFWQARDYVYEFLLSTFTLALYFICGPFMFLFSRVGLALFTIGWVIHHRCNMQEDWKTIWKGLLS